MPADDDLLQRVRDAILKGGGVPAVSDKTGIPKKTLEKYLSKRSTASLTNAAKIASAAGISLEELATPATVKGRPSEDEVAQFTISVVLEINQVLLRVYREEGAGLPVNSIPAELQKYFKLLLRKIENVGDLAEAKTLMPWIENRIRADLRELAKSLGTGKREAS